ncbi:hypothetical protein BC939DRAFT_454877 [Gamsiella multidivaricata]|uniref:uncharacterized protein n=1 Tax=Gamsiella multidivaricata TaxID=101098 RepID=UPI002220C6DE|nr:uncharacterized protein BC939DRAFT_454877 [Gamsiella multidivaricata]KAG0367475.1 hypothetical protein BGZ54_003819 [Gamsiella multidivaricata]KAI7821907.1 hypothetical protein BC939DRAFT_454877 [Gamsiella multidivaricata]
MKNQQPHSRLHHSRGSLFVLSTKSTGVVAAVAVGLAAAARPSAAKMTNGALLISVGALQCCWLGANLAISFLEAPVKFLAPSPSRRGLIDVGRHVFSALNKVEVILAAFDILGWYLLTQRGLIVPLSTGWTIGSNHAGFRHLGPRYWLQFTPGVIVLLLQSFGFLPIMRSVGERFIEGRPVENPRVHGVYVALEAVKVAALAFSTVSVGKALLKLT